MERIEEQSTRAALRRFSGKRVYLHFEMTRGGFIRNVLAEIEEAVLRADSDGSFRVALRCKGDGWVVMEGLTHIDAPAGMPLFLATFDDDPDQRLTRTLQLSLEPFPA